MNLEEFPVRRTGRKQKISIGKIDRHTCKTIQVVDSKIQIEIDNTKILACQSYICNLCLKCLNITSITWITCGAVLPVSIRSRSVTRHPPMQCRLYLTFEQLRYTFLAWWCEEFHSFIFIHGQKIQRSSNVKKLWNEPNLKSKYFSPPRISSEREVQHTWFIVVLIVAIFAFRTSYLELILELSIHALIEI